jgi:tRNA (guanine-N7-)-methyltransferase
MGKDKLRRFAEITAFENVIELEDGKILKGRWADQHFNNKYPIVLELGCGKGEYTVNLARLFPEMNFIGIDYKGNRIWRGAKTAMEENIPNVAFLRIQIENLTDYFSENEISEIWITFPDPQPQISRKKKRLTSPRFLNMYKMVLNEKGPVHLKTDSDLLHEYTIDKIKELGLKTHARTEDLYNSLLVDEVLSIKTYYEKKYLANDKNINYLKFSFD